MKRKIVAQKSDRKARQAQRVKRARVEPTSGSENEAGPRPTKDRRATVEDVDDEGDDTEHSVLEMSKDKEEEAEEERSK